MIISKGASEKARGVLFAHVGKSAPVRVERDIRRQRPQIVKPRVARVITAPQLTAGSFSQIENENHGGSRIVEGGVHVEKPDDLDVEIRLLLHLARRAPGRVFIRLDKTRRQGPHPRVGLELPLNEKDLPALDENDTAGGNGVTVVDELARRAHHPPPLLYRALDERAAAAGTVPVELAGRHLFAAEVSAAAESARAAPEKSSFRRRVVHSVSACAAEKP